MRKLLLLLVGACFLAGCSTHAMKAVPVFKSSPKPEEAEIDLERVNAWPLYYKDGDVKSAFWPIYTKTAEGHALVPFYEYRKGDRSLRVGQITHLLPALATFKPEEHNSWRVLLAYKEGRLSPLGRFARQDDDGFLLVPPVLFWNGETFWTPLITRGIGDEHSMWGFLYPFFFAERREDRKQFYAMAPLIAGWWGGNSTGGQAIPLFYFNKRDEYISRRAASEPDGRSTTLNLGMLLAHYYRNPVENSGIWALAWPLLHYSYSGEMSDADRRSRLNVALLAFHRSRHGDRRHTYFLWPLFQHSDHGTKDNGDARGGWVNVLGLAYHNFNSPDSERRLVLWPLYQHSDRGTDAVGNSRGRWTNVLGFVGHRYRDSNVSRGFVLWPLWIDRSVNDQEERIEEFAKYVRPSSKVRRDTLRMAYALAGLYADRREVIFARNDVTETESDAVTEDMPLFDRTIRDHWRLFPLFWSEKLSTGESKFLVLWRLYDARRVPLDTVDREWRRERILWRLYRREQRGTRTATDSFPFISATSDTATDFRRWTLAGGLYESRREAGVKSTKLLWIPVWKRSVRG